MRTRNVTTHTDTNNPIAIARRHLEHAFGDVQSAGRRLDALRAWRRRAA